MKTLIAAAVVVGMAAPLAAQDFEFRRELAAGSRFALRNIIGDVRVEATSGRQVDVTARKKAGRHGDPDDVEIRQVETDGGLAICVIYPGQRVRRDREDDRDDRDSRRSRRRSPSHDDPCHRNDGSWDGNNRNDTSIDFVVRLPAGLDLDIKTVSGDVIGDGIRGDQVDFGTVSGNVSLTDFTAASLDANSVSGDVDLARIQSREVSAETVSGDVTFGGTIHGQGRYDFKSLSGDVVLTLAGEPDAKVSAATFSGHLNSDFPVTRDDTRRRRNRFNATWGSGGAALDLESFSGDIEIRRAK
ncbi:MAG: DUF4097 family beta strand repeat-containing protein [Gemmatimonadales bacterium]